MKHNDANCIQNEDCEHIGDEVLEEVGMQVEDSMGSYHIADTHIEEVGMGVGDKDCPDCLRNRIIRMKNNDYLYFIAIFVFSFIVGLFTLVLFDWIKL